MYKKSLIIALAIICFNLHASNTSDAEKFQEFKYSTDQAKETINKCRTRKLHKKEEAEKTTQLSSTNNYLYGAASVVIIAGIIYVLHTHSNKK